MRRTAVAGALLAGCLLAGGAACAGNTPSGLDTSATISEAEANRQAAERITDAARELGPDAELVERPNQDVACTGLGNGGPQQVTIGKVYQVNGLDPGRGQEYADQLRAYWTGKGYQELDGSATYPLVRVEHPQDRFKLSFSVRNDVAELSAVISCIWPDGTPPPTTG
ncbi:MAG TPA: hypothetical protein VGD67_24900 [Pseudonocardiaceae bacterium]